MGASSFRTFPSPVFAAFISALPGLVSIFVMSQPCNPIRQKAMTMHLLVVICSSCFLRSVDIARQVLPIIVKLWPSRLAAIFNCCTDYFLVDIGGNICTFCHGLFIIKKTGLLRYFLCRVNKNPGHRPSSALSVSHHEALHTISRQAGRRWPAPDSGLPVMRDRSQGISKKKSEKKAHQTGLIAVSTGKFAMNQGANSAP